MYADVALESLVLILSMHLSTGEFLLSHIFLISNDLVFRCGLEKYAI